MPRPKTRNESLRQEVLVRTLELLEDRGPTAVTARVVASEAETSTAAVYELFGDKAGLVRSIFYEGFAQLAAELMSLPRDDPPREIIVAGLDRSRQFAVRQPMLFEVMYARPFAEFEPSAEEHQAGAKIYRHIRGLVSAWLGTPRRAAFTVDAAQAIIALNRGLIAEELAGILGTSTESKERRRNLAVTALLDGLEARQPDLD